MYNANVPVDYNDDHYFVRVVDVQLMSTPSGESGLVWILQIYNHPIYSGGTLVKGVQQGDIWEIIHDLRTCGVNYRRFIKEPHETLESIKGARLLVRKTREAIKLEKRMP